MMGKRLYAVEWWVGLLSWPLFILGSRRERLNGK